MSDDGLWFWILNALLKQQGALHLKLRLLAALLPMRRIAKSDHPGPVAYLAVPGNKCTQSFGPKSAIFLFERK